MAINFSKLLSSRSISSREFIEEVNKISDFSSKELAKYFLYRKNIIDCLEKYINRNESIEKLLHNLFIPQGEQLDNSLKNRINNNIWLLDDKFMSFTHAFSDISIKKIKSIIKEEDKKDGADNAVEPDLTIFYSNKSAIVIEFKALGASYNKKIDAISEINRNNGILASTIDNIDILYGYIITDFDDTFIRRMNFQNGVKKLFSNSENQVYYLYNENIKNSNGEAIPCHTYIMSAKSICKDANLRNKLFIDIIKNN